MMITILSPKGLSEGVVKSQIYGLADELSEKHEVEVMTDFGPRSVIKYRSILSSSSKVYVRDQKTYFCLFLIRLVLGYKYSLFFDFRGLGFEESYLRNRSKLRAFILKWFDKLVYRSSDEVGAVSYNLASYLKDNWGDRYINVLPCCVVDVIDESSLCINDRCNFVYVGGMSEWQCFDSILIYFKNIKRIKAEAELTVFTRDLEKAEEILSSYEVVVKDLVSLKQSEVLERLTEFDYGFLFREDLVLNQVASPIKLLEYTSNGVMPIITGSVGDYSADLLKKNLAIVVDLNELDNLSSFVSVDVSNIKMDVLDWSKEFRWKNRLENHYLNL